MKLMMLIFYNLKGGIKMILFLLLLIVCLVIGIILFILGLPLLPIILDLVIFIGIVRLLFFRKKKS